MSVVLQEEEEYETKGGRRRTWDDDFVLKRQFSALVPAFDPRPGRTNVQQTTDLEIPPPGDDHSGDRSELCPSGFSHMTLAPLLAFFSLSHHVLCSLLSGTPRSEVQEEVECTPSPHLSLTLKVRAHPPTQNTSTPEFIRPSIIRPSGSLSCCSCVQVAGLGTTREVELPLSNYKSTIFYYVQRLLQLSCNGAVKTDKLRRIWEPTYT